MTEDRAYVDRVVDLVVSRFDSLRETDMREVTLAHSDLSNRLEGFPQQFALKAEQEQAVTALQRLEKDSLSREMYDQQHAVQVGAIAKLDREKLPESVFDTFVENYRIEQAQAATERRSVAEVLATATETVRSQVMAERADYVTREHYDIEHNGLKKEVNDVQAWQYKLIGGLVFATFVAPFVTGMVVYLITKSNA